MKKWLTTSLLAFFSFGLSSFAATNVVLIGDYFYNPVNSAINAGDTILWTNTVNTSHDSTSRSNVWGSPTLAFHGTYAFTFTNTGNYPYYCVFHVIVHPEQTGLVSVATAPANVFPSVSLTNPITGAKFVAPASIPLQATASDSDGSVTNVQFFSGASLLGNVTAAPYNFTLNNVVASNYAFTARATDNKGAVSTSSVVNVFVLTNATLQNPVRLPSGQFKFTVLGIAGQTYLTEGSSNLTNWSPIVTNLAPANSFNVTDFTSTNILLRFYRTRQ